MTRRLTSRARYAPPSTPEPPLHELNHVTELAAGASRGATTGRFVDSQDGWGGDEGGKECHENKDCEALVIENLQKRKMK
uniref:Uncharacterized protein n=1 Tax=Salix viminalis TaxID=40686 RepID=A0A6N2KDS6_SALVM